MRLLVLTAVLALVGAAAAGADAPVPNDPGWQDQGAMKIVRVPQLWERTTGDPAVVIAVVDTGVNKALIDLVNNVIPGHDFVSDGGGDGTVDLNGHGTLVATEIGAQGNNLQAIAGYCWHCRIMPVRVSVDGKTDDDTLAAGIRWAADHGARIINVSFVVDGATGAADAPLASAVGYAQAKGALVVAAAGNSGGSAFAYPAALPGVLSVTGATDDGTALAYWATRGSWVQLAAPGCQIVLAPDTEWGNICGSSVTAPAVTGIAGLIMSLNPAVTATQVALALRTSAKPISGIGGGLVDAYGAAAALGLVDATPPADTPVAQRSARVITGIVRGTTELSARFLKGRVDLTLDMPDTRGCALEVASSSDSLLALPSSRVEIRVGGRFPTGRHAIRISCSTKRPRPFTLGIAAIFPTQR